MKLAIAGGGTGGHLFPGVAVAEEILSRNEGHEVVFVGTSLGIEARAVPELGYPLELIRARGLVGKGLGAKLRGLANLPMGAADSIRILRARRPDVVLGVGGYASGPFAMMAHLAGKPTAVMEQNSIPGRTNRILGRVASRVYIAFPSTGKFFKPGKSVLTGTPVRAEVVRRLAHAPEREPGPFTVLLFGGSQGARSLNDAMIGALPSLSDLAGDLRLIVQTGPADLERVSRALEQGSIPFEAKAFIKDMAGAYLRADLVVCRAGAGTVAELCAAGKPSILVPYPYAAHNHQEHNARALAQVSAARMILDRDLDGAALAGAIREYHADRSALARMGESARALGRPDAASRIVDDCLALAAGRR